MTHPAQRSPRPGAYGIAPPLLLAAVLVAVAVLFVQSWNGLDDERTFAERERQGVEYLRSLNQVTIALLDVRTATVAGRAASRDALNQAVEGTTTVDARLGGELRTRERWAGVRAKIEALPERGLSTPGDIHNAYDETSSLLLALYAKVRESSGLVRDPAADAYHLQHSAAEKLPETLVAAARLTDLANLARTRGADQRASVSAELTMARAAVLDPVEDVVQGLQAAADNTESRDLSGNLLQHLDAYQRAVEGLAGSVPRPASPTAVAELPDPARVEAARKAVQGAAADLVEVMLAELDALIEAELTRLTGQRRLAGATAAIGLVLGLGLAYLLLAPGRRRVAEQGGGPVGPGRTTADPGRDDGAGSWDESSGWAEPAGAFNYRAAPVDTGVPAGATPVGATVGAGTGSPAGGFAGGPGGGLAAGLAGSAGLTRRTTGRGDDRDDLTGQPGPDTRSEQPTRWGRSDAAR